MRLHKVTMLAMALLALGAATQAERRDEWFRYRIPTYGSFYRNYNQLYRIGALANFWNLHTYDVLLADSSPAYVDGPYYAKLKSLALGEGIRLDPGLEDAAPEFALMAWGVGQSFMWTHALHENAFDAYAAPDVTMEARRKMIEDATDHYLANPRALAPIEIPMERVRRLPYYGAFARKYPKITGLVWAGHWYHGGVYEGELAVLRGEKTSTQMAAEVDAQFRELVQHPPTEHPHFTHIAPEFARIHPRAAAIFANMHMLHDLVADILADDGITDKRTAIYEARNLMLAARNLKTIGGAEHAH